MSASNVKGAALGLYRRKGFPSWSQRNFVKFHLMKLPKDPERRARRKVKTGAVSPPLTLTLSKTRNCTPNFDVNSAISSLVPGSWLPN